MAYDQKGVFVDQFPNVRIALSEEERLNDATTQMFAIAKIL